MKECTVRTLTKMAIETCNIVCRKRKLCFFFPNMHVSILQFNEYDFLLSYMVSYFKKTFANTSQCFII